MTVVSVCLPCDALSQHLPSYWGFSDLGCGISPQPPATPVPCSHRSYVGRMESGVTRICIGGNNFVPSVQIWRGRPVRGINEQDIMWHGRELTYPFPSDKKLSQKLIMKKEANDELLESSVEKADWSGPRIVCLSVPCFYSIWSSLFKKVQTVQFQTLKIFWNLNFSRSFIFPSTYIFS